MSGIEFSPEFTAGLIAVIAGLVFDTFPGVNDLWAKVPKKYKILVVGGLCLLIPLFLAYGPCLGIPTYEGAVCLGWNWELTADALEIAAIAFGSSQISFLLFTAPLSARLVEEKKPTPRPA